MRRRRRISFWLGVLGAFVGYGFAAETGANVLTWTLGGWLVGAMSLGLTLLALKLVLVVTIVGLAVLVIYAILSGLAK